MRIKIKRFNCRHRMFGRGESAVEAFYVMGDGWRRSVGTICTRCVAEQGDDGLHQWAWHSMNYALAWLFTYPQLGRMEIEFVGIDTVLSDEQAEQVLGLLEKDKTVLAQEMVRLDALQNLKRLPPQATSEQALEDLSRDERFAQLLSFKRARRDP